MPTVTRPCPGLRAHRDAQGISQTEAATSIRVSRRTWARWEGNERAPVRALERVAQRWGLTVDELCEPPAVPPGLDQTMAGLVGAHGAAEVVLAVGRALARV